MAGRSNWKNEPALNTAGYGGRKLSDLVALLKEAEVETLADIRLSPRSPVPRFGKASLMSTLPEAGIDYRHIPELGNRTRPV